MTHDNAAAIAEQRHHIDRIDADMLSLLRQRADVVAALVALKRQVNAPAIDEAREHQMRTARRSQALSLGLTHEDADALCDALLSRGRAWQHR